MNSLLARIRNLGDTLERMSQRERAMTALLGVAFVGCVFLLLGYLIYSRLADLEERNDAMRQALRDIESKRGAYLQARAKIAQLEARIGTQPLPLSGFLEQAAKDSSIDIRETNPRAPEPVGKKYVQQSMDVRLSKVQLEPLSKFMRRLEQNPGNLVLVTQLLIRARDDKHQEFDVDMTVSTYEHAPKKPPKGKDAKEEGGAPEKEPS
jgi:hypothetical protein